MSKSLEIGQLIYNGVAQYMNEQTSNYQEFIKDGTEMTEEEKTTRILEIVNDNLAVMWSLFLIASSHKKPKKES